jgi:hypothetical protein
MSTRFVYIIYIVYIVWKNKFVDPIFISNTVYIQDGFIDMAEFKVCWSDWIKVVCWPRSALLVIDVQNDFISGTLAINNCPAGHRGEEVIIRIII